MIATFGAGCFWGVEEIFRQTNGVLNTRVGYSGGTLTNPTYQEVCTGSTGHAEVVEVEFDESKIKYDDLLNIFWENHNPTTLNQQGPDIGTQYRSVIFFHSEQQKLEAESSRDRLIQSKRFVNPIVTQIEAATEFFAAEDYHQQYLAKRGLSTCHI